MAGRVNTTKYKIIQVASRLFLEQGYSETSSKMICEERDISTGNLTYYFPSKEHLLTVLVEMVCDFQRKMLEEESNDGIGSAMAPTCEESETVKEFFLAAYSSPMALDLIRHNNTRRAEKEYVPYCLGWPHQEFLATETLVFGIEYAMLMTDGEPTMANNDYNGQQNQQGVHTDLGNSLHGQGLLLCGQGSKARTGRHYLR